MSDAFRRLHDGPEPLLLANAWDVLSARVLAVAGAAAIGTSSYAVAASRGYADGQHVPFGDVVDLVAAMVAAVDVPVSADIEAGQGAAPSEVAAAVRAVVGAGAAGVNLEDKRHDAPGHLFGVDEQCARIAAARDAGGDALFVNARCDVWFFAEIPEAERLDAGLDRASLYVEAGADGVFVPGLVDLDTLRQVTAAIAAPVNVMLWPGLPPIAEVGATGVRRVSQGAAGFLSTLAHLDASTRAYLRGEPEPLALHDVSPLLTSTSSRG